MNTPLDSTKDNRNYDSISPSAKALLLMKGLTPIPYAREAAALVTYPEPYTPDYSSKQPAFWARVLHFENRYQSIDQLLAGPLESQQPVTNILELSSGFSFRGLALVKDKEVHYIDTDLPGIITTKKEFIQKLSKDQGPIKGRLEELPLNALDEAAFEAIVEKFEPGPIIIVNEGLLVYLNMEEKERICGIIRRILEKRGGYWITADAYVKRTEAEIDPSLAQNDSLQQFFKQHQIEDNKFDSLEQAASFFERMGFFIDKEAGSDYTKLSSLQYLVASSSPELLQKMRQSGKVSATWRLGVK